MSELVVASCVWRRLSLHELNTVQSLSGSRGAPHEPWKLTILSGKLGHNSYGTARHMTQVWMDDENVLYKRGYTLK